MSENQSKSDSSSFEEDEPNVLFNRSLKYRDLDEPSMATDDELDFEAALSFYRVREKENNIPDMSKASIIDKKHLDNGEYKKIMDELNLESAVTLVLEGVNISRLGELHWIGIGTKGKEYLFNIEEMGQSALDNGLTKILEEPMILKIVHDGRRISDCLFHRYAVGIRNVFDTQTAGSVIFKRKHGFLSNFGDSLGYLLKAYIGVNTSRLPKLSPNIETEKQRSEEKPISMALKKCIVAKAKYLRPLKEVLLKEMLKDFETAVSYHLSSVADAEDSELPKLMASSHLYPVSKEEYETYEELKESPGSTRAWWERDPKSGQLEIVDPERNFRLKLSDRWGHRCVYKYH